MPMGFGSYAGRSVATNVVATDGTGDFSDIQTAINALPAGGGVVYVKEGTYTITESLLITKSNVALMGAGAASKITCGTNFNDELIVLGDASTTYAGIIIESLLFDGNNTNQSAGVDLLWLRSKINDSRIVGCWFQNSDTNGIDIDSNSARNHILSNTVTACTTDGMTIDATNAGTIIQGNFVYSNGDSGIYLAGSGGYTTIADNMCISNGEDGIECRGGLTMITGNTCSSNEENGIYVYSDHMNVTGNMCRYNKFNGIQLYAADFNTISNNYVYNSSYENDNTYSEIHLGNTSTYNIVSGNHCHADNVSHQAKYGIYEAAAADDYNLIVGNIVRGQQTDGILKQGANSIEANNIE